MENKNQSIFDVFRNTELVKTNINIPAYDINGKGLQVVMKINAAYCEGFSVYSKGRVAIALERNFKRIISIMSSLKDSWGELKKYSYYLECDNNNFHVRDARSSSLALSIAILNIYREINMNYQVHNITGTGVLRIDGSFEETHFEQQKYFAVKNSESVESEFITSKSCKHLFDLDDLLNEFKKRR